MINKSFNPDEQYLLSLPKRNNYRYEHKLIDNSMTSILYYQMTEHLFNKHMSYCAEVGIEPVVANRWVQIMLTKKKFDKVDGWSVSIKPHHVCNHSISEYWKIYLNKSIDKKTISKFIHRFILDNPEKNIDHINRDTFDNRNCNLRLCSHSENVRNIRVRVNSASGIRGIYKEIKHKGKKCEKEYWTGAVCFEHKYHLKRFPYTPDGLKQAKQWVINKRRELFGEFAGD